MDRGKKILSACLITVLVVAAVVYYFWFYHQGGSVGGCPMIPSYYSFPNGTLGTRIGTQLVNGTTIWNTTYISKSSILQKIQSDSAGGCCGVAELGSIGLSAADAYGLATQYNDSLATANAACQPGMYS